MDSLGVDVHVVSPMSGFYNYHLPVEVARATSAADRTSSLPAPATDHGQGRRSEDGGIQRGDRGRCSNVLPLREEGPWTVESLAALTGVDVVIRLSREQAERRVWPPVDPLTSRSRLFDDPTAPVEHAELASRVRGALALLETTPYGRQHAADERMIARAEKLRRFFGQPFFAAERYTKRPGSIVTRAESLRVCREILDGVHDDVPTDAFFFTGGIDEIRAKTSAQPGS